MHLIDYVIILVYLVLTVFIGLYLHKKASSGITSYFLGNRDIPWWALGASGMTSNIDITGTMIGVALVYVMGTMGFFVEIRGGVVLILAFFMVYMGKWTRRSQVITPAEWMNFRFGPGKQGDLARKISAISNLLLTIIMIGYFSIGSGKFTGELLGMDWRLAALLMIVASMIYTVASGFYGVVWTDVFQGFIIFIGIVVVWYLAITKVDLPANFFVSVPIGNGEFMPVETSREDWTRIFPPLRMDLPGEFSIYNLFGLSIMFYLFKVLLEGGSGGNGYMVQRYLAAKSDREAGLLTFFWTILLALKWPLIISFALLGIQYGISHQVIADPELVLPAVMNHYFPVGMKGVVVAVFMAAAMSTFTSTVNAGAAFWVRDLYQAYINPGATEERLVSQSRWSTIVIVILGVLFSFTLTNINEIWGWISMGIGAGLFIPQVLRWYWERFNGYGYAIGTSAGVLSAVIIRVSAVQVPEYYFFIVCSMASLLGCIVGTYATQPTQAAVVAKFYKTTRPFGIWKNTRKRIASEKRKQIDRENRRDIFSTGIAIVWQLALFLSGMMLVLGLWNKLFILLSIVLACLIILYYSWYRHLSSEVVFKPDSDESAPEKPED